MDFEYRKFYHIPTNFQLLLTGTILQLYRFGKLDLAVYNAGAILWKPVIETPLARFDLMHEVNVRGAYTMIQQALPHFLARKSGRIILVSPPIYNR